MIPGGADGDCCIGKSLWIQVGQPAAAIPAPEFLENDLFDVIRDSGIAQSWEHGGQLRDKLFSIVLVDSDGVELEQDLEQLVVQGTVLSLVAFARRPTGFVFARVGRLVHRADGPYRKLAVKNTALCRGAWLCIGRHSVGKQHAFAQ